MMKIYKRSFTKRRDLVLVKFNNWAFLIKGYNIKYTWKKAAEVPGNHLARKNIVTHSAAEPHFLNEVNK